MRWAPVRRAAELAEAVAPRCQELVDDVCAGVGSGRSERTDEVGRGRRAVVREDVLVHSRKLASALPDALVIPGGIRQCRHAGGLRQTFLFLLFACWAARLLRD